MTENITVKIIEQPGNVGAFKASQLSHVIVNFIQKHPEITQTKEEHND